MLAGKYGKIFAFDDISSFIMNFMLNY